MDYEQAARDRHRGGTNCSISLYEAFAGVNPNKTEAPPPRSEGGKCGAYLAADKLLADMGIDRREELKAEFIRRFGSLQCSDLAVNNKEHCNDYVGAAACMIYQDVIFDTKPICTISPETA